MDEQTQKKIEGISRQALEGRKDKLIRTEKPWEEDKERLQDAARKAEKGGDKERANRIREEIKRSSGVLDHEKQVVNEDEAKAYEKEVEQRMDAAIKRGDIPPPDKEQYRRDMKRWHGS